MTPLNPSTYLQTFFFRFGFRFLTAWLKTPFSSLTNGQPTFRGQTETAKLLWQSTIQSNSKLVSELSNSVNLHPISVCLHLSSKFLCTTRSTCRSCQRSVVVVVFIEKLYGQNQNGWALLLRKMSPVGSKLLRQRQPWNEDLGQRDGSFAVATQMEDELTATARALPASDYRLWTQNLPCEPKRAVILEPWVRDG